MIAPGSAGYSASRRAAKLYVVQARSTLLLAAGAGTAGTAAVAVPSGSVSVVSLVAGGAAGVGTAVWGLRRPGDWQRWLQGAKAEWRVGRSLNRLRRQGWGVLHDRRVPRSRANFDHVLAHPSGKFVIYVDTKAWHARNARIRLDQGRLMYGPWNQGQKVDTVTWEASRLEEELGLPTYRVIAVDGGEVVGGVINFNGTYVVGTAFLLDFLRGINATAPDARRARRVTRTIERQLTPAR